MAVQLILRGSRNYTHSDFQIRLAQFKHFLKSGWVFFVISSIGNSFWDVEIYWLYFASHLTASPKNSALRNYCILLLILYETYMSPAPCHSFIGFAGLTIVRT